MPVKLVSKYVEGHMMIYDTCYLDLDIIGQKLLELLLCLWCVFGRDVRHVTRVLMLNECQR
jgi:hypothetical protein